MGNPIIPDLRAQQDATAVTPARENPVQSLLKDIEWYRKQGATEAELNDYVHRMTATNPELHQITGSVRNVTQLKKMVGPSGVLFNFAQGALFNFADELEGAVNAAQKSPVARGALLRYLAKTLGNVGNVAGAPAAGAQDLAAMAATPEYQQMQQATLHSGQAAAAAHPALSTAAMVAGAALPAIASGGLAAPETAVAGPGRAALAGAGAGAVYGGANAMGMGLPPRQVGGATALGAVLGAIPPLAVEGARGIVSPGVAAGRRIAQGVERSQFYSPEQLRRAATGGVPLSEMTPLRGEAAVRAAAQSAGAGSVPADWTEALVAPADFAAQNSEAIRQNYGQLMKFRGTATPTLMRQVAGKVFDRLNAPLEGPAAGEFQSIAQGILQMEGIPARVKAAAQRALKSDKWQPYNQLRQSLRTHAEMIWKNVSGPSPTMLADDAQRLQAWADLLNESSAKYVPGFEEAMARYQQAAMREEAVLARQKRTLSAFGGSQTHARDVAAGGLDRTLRAAEWSPLHALKHVALSPFYGLNTRATAQKMGQVMFQPQSAEQFFQTLQRLPGRAVYPAGMAGAETGLMSATLPPWSDQQ